MHLNDNRTKSAISNFGTDKVNIIIPYFGWVFFLVLNEIPPLTSKWSSQQKIAQSSTK